MFDNSIYYDFILYMKSIYNSEEYWTQHGTAKNRFGDMTLVTNKESVSYCLVGAAIKTQYNFINNNIINDSDSEKLLENLFKHMTDNLKLKYYNHNDDPAYYMGQVIKWNDEKNREFSDIINLLDDLEKYFKENFT